MYYPQPEQYEIDDNHAERQLLESIKHHGLMYAPTTLSILGIALAKTLKASPFLGGVAGALFGSLILCIAYQTKIIFPWLPRL